MIHVRWLSSKELLETQPEDAAALVLIGTDRKALVRAWATLLDANVLPETLGSGELRMMPRLGEAVLFRPKAPLPLDAAKARWPELADRVRDAIGI